MPAMVVTEVVEKDKLPADIQYLLEQNKQECLIRKHMAIDKASELKEGERAEITYVSTVDMDRDDEVMLPSGCILTEFRKAMQVLWGHDYWSPPIGSDQWIKTDKRGVIAKTIYAETSRGEEVWQLVKAGHLKTSSVGFIPIKWVNKNDEGWGKLIDKLAREGIKIDPEKCKRIYTKWLLLEHSKVSVPANINALTIDVSKGLFKLSDDMLKDFGIMSFETKGVIPFKDYGKQTEDTAWDAAAQVREADTATLRKICSWFDSANPDVKAAYKLPHHNAASLKCNWRGTAAAMAALLGARGGVDIPDGDRKGVYNHLVKHYKQFDKEPPDFKEYNDLELKGFFGHDIFEEAEFLWFPEKRPEPKQVMVVLPGEKKKEPVKFMQVTKTAEDTIREETVKAVNRAAGKV